MPTSMENQGIYHVSCHTSAHSWSNEANSPNCCSGQFDTAATCPSSGVEFYSYFKGNCPQRLRLRIRREQRNGALDLPLESQCRLHSHFLPVSLVLCASFRRPDGSAIPACSHSLIFFFLYWFLRRSPVIVNNVSELERTFPNFSNKRPTSQI